MPRNLAGSQLGPRTSRSTAHLANHLRAWGIASTWRRASTWNQLSLMIDQEDAGLQQRDVMPVADHLIPHGMDVPAVGG